MLDLIKARPINILTRQGPENVEAFHELWELSKCLIRRLTGRQEYSKEWRPLDNVQEFDCRTGELYEKVRKRSAELPSPVCTERAQEAVSVVDMHQLYQGVKQRYNELFKAYILQREYLKTIRKNANVENLKHPGGVGRQARRILEEILGDKVPPHKNTTCRDIQKAVAKISSEISNPEEVSHKEYTVLIQHLTQKQDDAQRFTADLNKLLRADMYAHICSKFHTRIFNGEKIDEDYVRSWIREHVDEVAKMSATKKASAK